MANHKNYPQVTFRPLKDQPAGTEETYLVEFLSGRAHVMGAVWRCRLTDAWQAVFRGADGPEAFADENLGAVQAHITRRLLDE